MYCILCSLANYFASAYWVSWEMKNLTKLQETKKKGATEKCNTIETIRLLLTLNFCLPYLFCKMWDWKAYKLLYSYSSGFLLVFKLLFPWPAGLLQYFAVSLSYVCDWNSFILWKPWNFIIDNQTLFLLINIWHPVSLVMDTHDIGICAWTLFKPS